MAPVNHKRSTKTGIAVRLSVLAAAVAPAVAVANSDCASVGTTLEQTECLKRALRLEEAALTRSFRALLASSTNGGQAPGAASIRTSLEASQAHWRKHRSLECGAKALTVAGSAAALVGLECEIEFTKVRGVLLSRWLELRVPILEPAYGWK